MNQVHSNADNEIALLVPILVGSHTYTSKSLWWSFDVGRNPRGRSFTFGEDPYEEHEERAEEHEGNHGGKQERHSTNTNMITHVLDHRGTK